MLWITNFLRLKKFKKGKNNLKHLNTCPVKISYSYKEKEINSLHTYAEYFKTMWKIVGFTLAKLYWYLCFKFVSPYSQNLDRIKQGVSLDPESNFTWRIMFKSLTSFIKTWNQSKFGRGSRKTVLVKDIYVNGKNLTYFSPAMTNLQESS